tara:strand:+ start:517 stop:735 length:219 start_codon:yes stop_codon:yes gene_type:complete
MVILEKKSQVTGKIHMREIDMDAQLFAVAHEAWETGTLIQNAFPNLDADDREFIRSGITPSEWSATYGALKA